MIANKQTIREIFDGAADTYDRTGPRLFEQFGRRLAEHLQPAPGAIVLDIATGLGAVSIPAARQVGPSGRVIAADLSESILEEGRLAARTAGSINLDFICMDAECHAFPSHTFDAVTCAFALFLFPDLSAALGEMARVCKPDGHIALTVFGREPRPFDPGWPILYRQISDYKIGVRMPNQVAYTVEELRALLAQAGLKTVEMAEELNQVVYGNLEDWWAFQLTVGSRAAIMRMDIATRGRFKQEYLGRLEPLLQPDGLHLQVPVLYALASPG